MEGVAKRLVVTRRKTYRQSVLAPAESPSTKPMRGIAADLHRAAAGDKVSKAAVSKTVSMGTKVAERKTALSELQRRRPIR